MYSEREGIRDWWRGGGTILLWWWGSIKVWLYLSAFCTKVALNNKDLKKEVSSEETCLWLYNNEQDLFKFFVLNTLGK